MSKLFPNQYWGMDIWKHQELPILESHDLNFYRCLEFKESFYGKMISELHSGNLRVSRADNRYSNCLSSRLFANCRWNSLWV